MTLRTILLAIVVVVGAAAVSAVWSYVRLSREIDGDIRAMTEGAQRDVRPVGPEMIAELPAPVRRYLTWSGVAGKPIPSVVRVKQTGRIRGNADASWMAFEADEFYATDPPGFVWRAFFPKRSMAFVFGRDAYLDGKGSIVMKALGVYPVADLSGDDLGPAGLMRYLNEMMWFPAAYLGDNVTWTAIDDRSAQVTLTDRGMSATGTWFFGDDGRPVNFRAQRYNTDTGRTETWETPMSAYGEFESLNLPTEGSGVWRLADGDFTYIELAITEVAYGER